MLRRSTLRPSQAAPARSDAFMMSDGSSHGWQSAPAPSGPVAADDLPRLKVLVSAFAVSPVGGSEPGVGWHFVSRLARWHEVTVLCCPGMPGERDFRSEIAAHLQGQPVPGLTIEFVDPPILARLLQRESPLRRRTVYYVGYRAWQRAAFRSGRRLLQRANFDVVHHLNITGFREPGDLWQLGIPFVWGPIEGAANLKWSYLRLMGLREQLFYATRNVTNGLQKRLLPRPRAAARRASHIWAVSTDEARMVQRFWGRTAECIIENGAQPVFGSIRQFDGTRPLRLVWNGLHVGRKALPILLHALHRLDAGAMTELTVLGSGPATREWQRLTERLGLTPSVSFTGAVPHAEALSRLRSADVLAHTSILEGTATVVLEALSACAPIICHDIGGLGVAVTDSCGIKLPLLTPEESIEGFRKAIERMLDEPDLVRRLSEGAAARAGELNWDDLARRVASRYVDVARCPRRLLTSRPKFPAPVSADGACCPQAIVPLRAPSS